MTPTLFDFDPESEEYDEYLEWLARFEDEEDEFLEQTTKQ
jgi:hypothetical protein